MKELQQQVAEFEAELSSTTSSLTDLQKTLEKQMSARKVRLTSMLHFPGIKYRTKLTWAAQPQYRLSSHRNFQPYLAPRSWLMIWIREVLSVPMKLVVGTIKCCLAAGGRAAVERPGAEAEGPAV